jgi:hypothetical protein
MSALSTTALNPSTNRVLARFKNPSLYLGVILITALFAFEMFNYSTTEYALRDMLGNLKFAGITWGTILSIAFCGIDFAGIARLFTPEQGIEEPKEVWYLFGAWLLAATMNAILTWWGVSLAIASQTHASNSVVDPKTLTFAVPIFVALMVWVIRILLIGSISLAGERLLFSSPNRRSVRSAQRSEMPAAQSSRPAMSNMPSRPTGTNRPMPIPQPASAAQAEPRYHTLNASSRPSPRNLSQM